MNRFRLNSWGTALVGSYFYLSRFILNYVFLVNRQL